MRNDRGIITKQTGISIGLVIVLIGIGCVAAAKSRQVDINSERIDSIEGKINKIADDVSYMRGQWDTRFKEK